VRGLAPLERRLLQNRADGGPRILCPPGSAEYEASANLLRQGRTIEVLKDAPECPGGLALYGYATDLGRLALRVCPTGEFV